MIYSSTLKGEVTGVVVENNDPLHLQRLRIRVSEWHTDVPDAQLPWFTPEKLDAWGSTATAGSFGPPLIGSKMWVKLHNGDAHSPVYMGYIRDTDRVVPQSTPNYPHRVGFETGSNDYFYLDRQSGDTTFVHRTNTKWFITGSSGRFTENLAENYISNVVGTVNVTIGSTKTVNVSGTTNVTNGGNITMTCPTFHHLSLVHISQTLTCDQNIVVATNGTYGGNVSCATLSCNLLVAGSSAMDGGTY